MGVISDELKRLDGEWVHQQADAVVNWVETIKLIWNKLGQMITYYNGEGDTESVNELTIKKNQLSTLLSNLSSYCS